MTVDADPTPADDLAGSALTLARCFAAGATMWCVAPPWPAHGRHVAVEFVHPVIVGKRALPAVSVEGADVVGALRLLTRPDDVLLVVSAADDSVAEGLLRRAEAWGLTRLWLGAGTRPLFGQAEHVVWMEGVEPAIAARSGDLVMLYHLLWELTHVVFEHPGLLAAEVKDTDSGRTDSGRTDSGRTASGRTASGRTASGRTDSGRSDSGRSDSRCSDEVCITCSDEGRVAEVTSVGAWGQAEVVVAGRPETVDVSLVDPVDPGDLVLVHAGVALTTLEAGGMPRSRS